MNQANPDRARRPRVVRTLIESARDEFSKPMLANQRPKMVVRRRFASVVEGEILSAAKSLSLPLPLRLQFLACLAE